MPSASRIKFNIRTPIQQALGYGLGKKQFLPSSLTYFEEVDTYRTTALTDDSKTLIDNVIRFLQGESTDWSEVNNLTPVDVWDNIVFFNLFQQDVNAGEGTTMVPIIGLNSSGVPSLISNSEGLGDATDGSWTWDDFDHNKRMAFPWNGYEIEHGAAGPGLSVFIGGFNADNELWNDVFSRSGTGQGNKTSILWKDGAVKPDKLDVIGWRGESFRGTQGLIWDNDLGGNELANFDVAFWQGVHYAKMNNGATREGNLLTKANEDTYDFQETNIVPTGIDFQKTYDGFNAGTPLYDATPCFLASALVLADYISDDNADNIMRGLLQADIDAALLNTSSGFRTIRSSTNANSIVTRWIISPMAGFIRIRVLEPTAPAGGKEARFMHVMDPNPIPGQVTNGRGIEHCGVTEAYHNDYNFTLVQVDFPEAPWYADNPTFTHQKWESFYTDELIPWLNTTYGTKDHGCIGFSKSGWGSITSLFRNQNVYAAGACYDAPLGASTIGDAKFFGAGEFSFGTQANLDTYNPYTLAENADASFLSSNRIWIGKATGTSGNFASDMDAYDTKLTNESILHDYFTAGTSHNWNGDWTDSAMLFLDGAF